jgi:hypothetical protein
MNRDSLETDLGLIRRSAWCNKICHQHQATEIWRLATLYIGHCGEVPAPSRDCSSFTSVGTT